MRFTGHIRRFFIPGLFSSLMLVLAFSCKECPTEPDYDIFLAVEEVFCTAVYLKVSLPDSGKINHFELARNDSTIAAYTCSDDDTLITDNDLTPDTDYTYRVRFLKNGKTKAQSGSITLHTMPTSSHNFVWEVDTLGIYGSYLNDVWIVDEDDIWVVGYIWTEDTYTYDSLRVWQTPYNAAHWNGSHWKLSRFERGVPLNSIWYFNENDIWASGGVPIHWDGNTWDFYHLWDMGVLDQDDGGVEHIWASSPDDIYFVGRKGSIVHYDGSTFRKIESGTDITLTDIYGYSDNKVFICGYNRTDGRCILLKGDQSGFEKIYESDNYDYFGRVELSSVFQSVWINNRQLYIASSAGFWQQPISSDQGYLRLWREIIPDRIWPNCIRGTDHNNIFIVADMGDVVHFNGETFVNYVGSRGIEFGPPQLYSVTCKDNLVVVCGILNSTYQGIVYRGRHLGSVKSFIKK